VQEGPLPDSLEYRACVSQFPHLRRYF
jgi:hypothetical protein